MDRQKALPLLFHVPERNVSRLWLTCYNACVSDNR